MKKLFAIYDVKSESYGPVFGVPHDAVAIREFGAALSNEQSPLAKYPDDFELHCVGEFVDDMGRRFVRPEGDAHPDDNARVVITARQWIDAQPKRDSQIPLSLER